jgi:hypothetical protein
MAIGEDDRLIEEVITSRSVPWEAIGPDEVKAELQGFFFHRLGRSPLSWTYQAPQTTSITTACTTWLTYFQALRIVDDRYLLCDPAHSHGNQQGLILSSFLGLRLAEPMNRLGVVAQRARREQRTEQARIDGEKREAAEEIARHEARIAELRTELAGIEAIQRRRREAVRESPAVRLVEVERTLAERSTEQRELLERRDELGRDIRQARAEGRRLREAVTLHLHFTGLSVSVCPNCDGEVDEAAVRREEAEHLCRLCGRVPRSAPAEELSVLEAQAHAAEARSGEMERDRDGVNTRLRTLASEIKAMGDDATLLRQAAEQGVDAAFPTPEEAVQSMRVAEVIGGLNAQIHMARQRAMVHVSDDEADDLRWRVVEKARDLLRAGMRRFRQDGGSEAFG